MDLKNKLNPELNPKLKLTFFDFIQTLETMDCKVFSKTLNFRLKVDDKLKVLQFRLWTELVREIYNEE